MVPRETFDGIQRHFYRADLVPAAQGLGGSPLERQAAHLILEYGIGFTDAYTLYDRSTHQSLPIEISPTYPPSQVMKGLILDRLATTGPPLPTAELAPASHLTGVSQDAWFIGGVVLPVEDGVLGFAGREDFGGMLVDVVMETTPQNVVGATMAAIHRGFVDPSLCSG
jgi:hypothetical protein